MPGLGVITQRSTGETIDAAKYNGDRQELVNMMEPQQIDDYSANTTQMQTITDPGDIGSESLPTTIAGENERIRFCIKRMKGTSQWYVPNVTKRIHPQIVAAFTQGNWGWPDGSDTTIVAFFKLPDDWVSGNLTVNLVCRAASGTGQIRMSTQTYRIRNASAIAFIDTGSAFNYSPGDTNSQVRTYSISTATLAAGDYVRADFIRVGSDGATDTNTGFLAFDGMTVTYTGIAGRS